MEGSEGDIGAPDSWELADLDETMSRLLVSSASSKKTPPPEFVDDVTEPALPSSNPVPPSDSSSSQAAAADQVDQFLREALEKPRERLAILRMEQDIEKFIGDPARQQDLELQPLPNSYLRLAAHRIAQHYSLQSIALPDTISSDGSNSRIFLRKTPSCGLPPIRLADIPVNLPKDENSALIKVAIKQRPQKYPHNASSSGAYSSSRGNQSKSVEERKEEYNRARARIFSSNDWLTEGDGVTADSSFRPSPEEKPVLQPSGLINVAQESVRGGTESVVTMNRYRMGSRVAIFRDRELDRKDPDYDRNYDRYVQRFDPGFGFNGGGAYGIQPLYAPAVNYNTEFPQLGSSHATQISAEHQRRPVSQHLHRSWSSAGSPSGAVGYGPPEGLMPLSFSPSPISPPVYLPPSPQYLPQPRGNPRPGMGFVHRQSQQQQSEANYGLARPR